MMLGLFTAVGLAKEVTVTGYGTSRDEALNDAWRQGVEQAVGMLVESETLVRNLAVVKDEIYAKSRGFVQDYDIVNEEHRDGQVILTVRVRVDTAPSSALMSQLQQLKMIAVGLRDPRIAVIIPEYQISAQISEPVGETAVIRKLLEAGFTHIVDARQVQGIRYSNTIKAIAQGNQQEALAMATTLGVDYLVVGEAFSQYVGNIQGSGVLSSQARVEARLFKADNGEIIAANGFRAAGVDITELSSGQKALNNAGELMGNYMVQQFMNFASNPEKSVQLVVKGVTSFAKMNTLERELRQVTGVKNVFVRSYNGGIGTIDVSYTGAPKTLATAIETFSDINLSVTEISNSAVLAIIK